MTGTDHRAGRVGVRLGGAALRARLRRLGAAAALAALAGCSTVQAINPFQSDAPAPKTAPVQPITSQPRVDTGDPLLRLIATMPVTSDQTFREPATGEVLRVRVVRVYAAASGRTCREYRVTNQSGQEQIRLACANGDRWVSARPLRQDPSGSAATRAQ
jgi:hypothetical protein